MSFKTFKKSQAGSTAVEFSFVAMGFLMIFFCIIEAGRIFWIQNAVQYSVESASRTALIDFDISESDIEEAARNALSSMRVSPDDLTINASLITLEDVDYVEINATYQYSALVTAFLPVSMASFDLNASTRRPLIWNITEE